MIHGRNVITVLAVLLLPVAAAAAPAGKVVIAQGVDPTTLDIMNQQESPASIIAAHIFETLWERDPNLKIIPALATEMPKLVAPTTWEVKLRKGVKFHNGEDFNAESAKFSIERVKDPKLRASSNFRPIESVEVVDPYTIRVHTAKPWPTFLTVMTFAQAAMYPPKAYAGKQPADISRQPIGTIQLMFQTHNFDEKTHQVTGVYEGPTKDKRVRQAIQYALDVDEIIKGVLDGKAMRMATMLTPMHFGFDPALKPIKQDVAKVKKLLTEAGYPNGLELTLNGPQGRSVRDKAVAEASAG